MSGQTPLPPPCAAGQHEPAIVHRSGGKSARTNNCCGKCGRAIERDDAHHPWRLCEEPQAQIYEAGQTTPRRVYGKVLCLGCGQSADVVYTYTNSDDSLCINDHEKWASKRCEHAGLNIWTKDGGWREERFRQRYGEASIIKTGERTNDDEQRTNDSAGETAV